MLYYRLYFMDRFSGHIEHHREFEAEDDEAAIATAEGWREGGPGPSSSIPGAGWSCVSR